MAPIKVLCYVMLCYVMLCYVMLCYVMLCYVMLCYVMLCYVMLCCSYTYKTKFIIFKIKHKLYIVSGPPPLPPIKNFGYASRE